MVASTPPTAGENWAYQHNVRSPIEHVVVTAVGTKKPPRVKIRFLDESAEGRDEWVPPGRLKVRWNEVDAWKAREERWAAVRAASTEADETAIWAATMVYEVAAPEDVIQVGWRSADDGLLFVRDPEAAAGLLGVAADDFVAHPAAFIDESGTVVAPWPVTTAIAERAAPRFTEKLLAEVADSEARARDRAVYGEDLGTDKNPMYIRPEVCAEVDRRWEPTHELVRRWCGQDVVERFDELAALRKEVLRVGKVAERAIRAVAEHGHPQVARRLEEELGVPVSLLRAGQRRHWSGP